MECVLLLYNSHHIFLPSLLCIVCTFTEERHLRFIPALEMHLTRHFFQCETVPSAFSLWKKKKILLFSVNF